MWPPDAPAAGCSPPRQFFQPGGAQRASAKGRIRPAEFPRKVYIVRTRAEDIRSRASVVQERHTPENAHSPRCFGRRAANQPPAEDDSGFPSAASHTASAPRGRGIHILYMIEYHTIFILKKTDRFFRPLQPSENSAGAADEAPLPRAAAPDALHPRGATQNASAGQTHEIRILTQLCAGQRAKIWRRGKDFLAKAL